MRPLRILALVAALLCGAEVAGSTRTLTIVHVNDLHSRLTPDRGRGGFAWVAAAIERECAAAETCLVLDAGDLAQGSPVSSLFRGLPVFEIANDLGLQASTLGNHEFDYGWRRIADFLDAAKFPIIGANVVNDEGRLLADAPYVVLDAGGIRVGVIGVLTEELPRLVTPDKYEGWTIRPVVETVRRLLPELSERCDLVVVLGHIVDREEEELLAELPGVAAVVAGHGHEGLDRARSLDGRVAVRVAGYGREVGRLDLTLDAESLDVLDWRWRKIPVRTRELRPDARVAERVAHWEAKVSALVDVPIGTSKRSRSPRKVRELLERALLESAGADLGYVNAGGVRDGLPRGPLLARHIWNVMPFDNSMVVGEFRGSELPRAVTERHRVDPERTYRLATMDFVATMWNRDRSQELRFEDTGRLVRDVVIEWVRERGTLE